MAESTIKSLAERLAPTRAAGGAARRAAPRAARSAPSPAQLALLRRVRSGEPVRNLFVSWTISPAPDPGRMEQAAQRLLRRHEILRSVYPDDRRIPYRRVLDVPDLVVVHGEEPAADNDIDISRELPIRITMESGNSAAVLSVAVHPIAADDRSLAQIAQELGHGYRGAGTDPPAHEPPVAQYADVVAEAAPAAAEAVAGGADAWSQRVGAAGETPRTPAGPRVTARAQVDVPGPGRIPAAAALALIVGGVYTEWGVSDVSIGVLDTVRPAGADAVVGPFARPVVRRIQVDPQTTPAALLARAAAAPAAAGDPDRNPTGPQNQPARLCLVASGQDGARLVVDGHQVGVREYRGAGAPASDLEFTLHPADEDGPERGPWSIAVSASAELAAAADIHRFAARLETLAAAWVADPRRALGPGTPATAGAGAASAPDPEPARLVGFGGPAQGPAERAVEQAFRAVLELGADAEIGREDSFFALGGDSLAALRLVARLQAEGAKVEVQTLFEHPVLRDVAARIGDLTGPVAPAPAVEAMSASGLDPATLAALRTRPRNR